MSSPRTSRPRLRSLLATPAAALATAGLLAAAHVLGSSPATASPAATAVLDAAPVLGTTATAPADPSAARVGALFSGTVGPGHHFCSASVLQSPTRDLVLTAAHCVGSTDGLSFVPAYRDGSTPYGSWKVAAIYAPDAWTQDRDEDADYAILRVAPASDGHRIEDVVGGNALGLDDTFTSQVRLYGYPARTEAPLLCTDTTTRQSTTQRRIDCPGYPGGTSGGPWISTRTGEVVGVIGGYQEGGDTDDTSYSSYFDHTMTTLYRQAVTAAP
ncbi:serine protease [Kitasatospora arboriphila]|uniref:Trypsin-like peptidase domain-containing protein n=1 Tax=Kitasatospora arboriphila TaxID=258052 RepID=A0ABN1TV66_9ACTN